MCCVERRMCINLSDCCKSVGGVCKILAPGTTDSSVSRVPDLADKGKELKESEVKCHCAKTVTQ